MEVEDGIQIDKQSLAVPEAMERLADDTDG